MLRRTGPLASARYALTDRHGGVSGPPYDALDLGDHVGDDPAAVGENRRLLALALGVDPARLVFMSQVHGAEVAVVEHAPEPGEPPPVADALVTAEAGLALVVLAADCVPVLLADRDGGAVGVAHAGRRGLLAGIVPATLGALGALGARPDRIAALVGPAVCGACYEVPEAMADEVAAAVPAARATSRAGGAALDLRAGVVAQLTAAGVGQVEVDPPCTVETADLYSYRRDGVTGRCAGVVVA